MVYTADGENRLDIFVSEMAEISRSQAKNLIENGQVCVDGEVKTKSGTIIRQGQSVAFDVPEPVSLEVSASDIPLDIVFEDDSFAVINKPKGMIVHQSSSYHKNDTLVNALLFHLKNLSGINGVIRPGIVHRLDKDTSGLLVVAKSDQAHRSLASQIEQKSAKRIYWGLVDGNVKEDTGRIDKPIARSKKDRKKMAIDPNGRNAVTNFRVLARYGKYTLMEFSLETGRTHQIRVHMKEMRHSIVGDETYSGSTKLFQNGQLLHAKSLSFVHPKTGEQLKFECDLPDFFEEVLAKIENLKI